MDSKDWYFLALLNELKRQFRSEEKEALVLQAPNKTLLRMVFRSWLCLKLPEQCQASHMCYLASNKMLSCRNGVGGGNFGGQ